MIITPSTAGLGLSLSTLGGWVMIVGCLGVHLFRLWERRFGVSPLRRRLSSRPAENASGAGLPPGPDPAPFVRAAGLTDVERTAAGLEFTVFRCRSPSASGPLALRIPNSRTIHNANDPDLDARALLEQELAVYAHLRASPVPVPSHRGLLETKDGDVAMLASFVTSDDSVISPRDMGRMLGALHALPPPSDFVPAVQEGEGILETIVLRLSRRWDELARLAPHLPSLPSREELLGHLGKLNRFSPSLLHMDFRAANLRTENGKIVAVVDWENSLIGPPAVELCRLRQTAHPGEGFEEGYAETAAQVPELSAVEETVLRLDAAVMLALVFLSEAPDLERGKECMAKVRHLAKRLETESGKTRRRGKDSS